MTLFYSAATGGFFDTAINPEIPDDAKPITIERRDELFTAQALGKIIVADDVGRPIASDPPLPAAEVLVARMRATRDRLLAQSDFTQLADAPLSEPERDAWRTYRQALRDLPGTIESPQTIIWPTAPDA